MSYDRSRSRSRSRGYLERDRHGNERVFFRSNSRPRRSSPHPRRSSPHPRLTDREMANELEEQNAEMEAVVESLRTQLAVVEDRNWNLTSDNSALNNMIRMLRVDKEKLSSENEGLIAEIEERNRDIEDLEERVDELEEGRERAEARSERAEERMRTMTRGVTGRGILSERGLRQRLEDKTREVERLEATIRLKDAQMWDKNLKLEEKDNKLSYIRRWLLARGFVVEL
ncbi:hypothetical protein NHQ30_005883 [Ciborinia camelliae]|nr:hypothetical protein NHQ30_005883 [Ciborinia camelliae]